MTSGIQAGVRAGQNGRSLYFYIYLSRFFPLFPDGVMQCDAVCCSVLQCVAVSVRCSVSILQCVSGLSVAIPLVSTPVTMKGLSISICISLYFLVLYQYFF